MVAVCNSFDMRAVTPKSLILDILRVSSRPVPVRDLVRVGALFEIEGNALRVALTRLLQGELVVRDERGYRLAGGASVVGRLVDGWRLGDKRLRPWKGEWLCVHWLGKVGRSQRQRGRRALERLGFGEGLEGLWLRPDNLRQSRADTAADLRELGLGPAMHLFSGRDFEPELIERWRRTLWDGAALDAARRHALEELASSRARLAGLSIDEALAESFLVGGHGIRVLATDPLLPDAIADGASRRALHEELLNYDRHGKRLWRKILGPGALETAPGHLADEGVAHVRSLP